VLEELRISGLGVISDTSLVLSPGLTAITGETGAGKTMIVAGLGLLFGGRADPAMVRSRDEGGAAAVEGVLRLAGEVGRDVRERVEQAGGACEESVVLTRLISAAGRSRAHVGGRIVPVAVLGEIGERVISVHGQSDQLRLFRPDEQRAALDRYAGPAHDKLLAAYRDAYAPWWRARAELARRREAAGQLDHEAELLRLGLREIRSVAPLPGEDVALREEASRLEHVDGLREAATEAYEALGGDVGGPRGDRGTEPAHAGGALDAAWRSLHARAGLDPSLGELGERVAEARSLVTDVVAELLSYLDRLDADPQRLGAVQQRRALLRALTRRYGDDVDAVLAWADRAEARLAELDASPEALESLAAQEAQLGAEVARLAGEVSASRRAAAQHLAADVGRELTGLAMPHASVRFEVAFKAPNGGPTVRLDGAEAAAGPDGADEVEITLTPHPGAPARPLRLGASGGELSRVMLALEVVLAGSDGPGTLVFDEVDAGVGGVAAVEVGRRLARLACRHQVIVITHLPQVAAYADEHLVVAKDTDGAVTVSCVRTVEEGDRARELARMLAGLPGSDLGLAHAEELLALANQDKAGTP
jgi:DNA repair protein RecN (Recombination protein N)